MKSQKIISVKGLILLLTDKFTIESVFRLISGESF